MKTTVQARLDAESQTALDKLVRQLGCSTSEVIRKGIHLVAKEAEAFKPIKIIGLGEFNSGIRDLATNKKHLAGLGRSSMPGGKPARNVKSR